MNNNQLLSHLPDKDVIFAGLHGSRAYGLDNQDSDYDLKFVWKCPIKEYLSIFDIQNTGYSKKVDNIDVTGWELKHFLNLVRKNNMTALEVLQTEDLLNKELFAKLSNYLQINFNRISLALQYHKAAKSYFYKYKETNNIKYLRNSYRCCVNFLYIKKTNKLPTLDNVLNRNTISLKNMIVEETMVEHLLNDFNIEDYSTYNTYLEYDILDNIFRNILFN